MPIYEYDCQKCGTFEKTQRITEKPLGRCPTCKGKVKKLISNTSFQLKGTGWYITDYARKSHAAKDGAKDGNGAKPSPSDSKADSKTEKSSSSSEKSSTKTDTTSNSTSA